MFARLLFVIVALTALAAALLVLRQQRFEAMHEMAVLHRQVDGHRVALWRQQSRIAADLEPARLRSAIVETQLPLTTITPQTPGRGVKPNSNPRPDAGDSRD